VDFKLTNSYSPMLFTADGYQLVVMPMMSNQASEQAKADREAKAGEAGTEPTTTEPAEPEAEAVADEPTEAEAEAEPEDTEQAEPKPKRSRKREKVAVA